MTTEENMMDLHKPFGNAGGMRVPVMVNDSGISRVGRHLPSGCAGTLDYNPLLSVVDTQRLPSLCHISDNENGVPVGRNGQLPETYGHGETLWPSLPRGYQSVYQLPARKQVEMKSCTHGSNNAVGWHSYF